MKLYNSFTIDLIGVSRKLLSRDKVKRNGLLGKEFGQLGALPKIRKNQSLSACLNLLSLPADLFMNKLIDRANIILACF